MTQNAPSGWEGTGLVCGRQRVPCISDWNSGPHGDPTGPCMFLEPVHMHKNTNPLANISAGGVMFDTMGNCESLSQCDGIS